MLLDQPYFNHQHSLETNQFLDGLNQTLPYIQFGQPRNTRHNTPTAYEIFFRCLYHTLTKRDKLLMQRKLSNHGLGLRSMETNLEFLFLAGFLSLVTVRNVDWYTIWILGCVPLPI